jgi:hypothetical protein
MAGRYDEAVTEAIPSSQPNSLSSRRAEVYFFMEKQFLGRDPSTAAEAEACFARPLKLRKAIEVAKGH